MAVRSKTDFELLAKSGLKRNITRLMLINKLYKETKQPKDFISDVLIVLFDRIKSIIETEETIYIKGFGTIYCHKSNPIVKYTGIVKKTLHIPEIKSLRVVKQNIASSKKTYLIQLARYIRDILEQNKLATSKITEILICFFDIVESLKETGQTIQIREFGTFYVFRQKETLKSISQLKSSGGTTIAGRKVLIPRKQKIRIKISKKNGYTRKITGCKAITTNNGKVRKKRVRRKNRRAISAGDSI